MLTECREFLNSYGTAVEEYLNIVALLPHLLAHQLLTRHEEEILNNTCITNTQKIQHLLMFIKQKGSEGLVKFIKAIEEETSHFGHKELSGILIHNLPQQVDNEELHKKVLHTQMDSRGKNHTINDIASS